MNSIVVDKFLIIPFVDGGRSFKGCDCWGLVKLVFKECGIDLPDFKIACSLSLKINRTVDNQRRFWKPIETPIAPCLVVMRTDSKHPKVCNHLGVYIGEEMMIHTFKKIGVSKTSIHHPFFSHCIEGYYVPRI